MAVTDSQGSTFKFGSATFKATKISVSYGGGSSSSSGAQQIDVSTLDIPSGGNKAYQSPPLNEVSSSAGTGILATVSVDFLDLQKPTLNLEQGIDMGAKLALSGKAKCTEYSLDASVNDVIRGSATFEVTSFDAVYTAL